MTIKTNDDSIAVILDTKVNNLEKLIEATKRVDKVGDAVANASKKFFSFNRAITSAVASVGGLGVAGAFAMDRLLNSSITVADRVANISSSFDLPIEKLQQLARAGEVINSSLNFDMVSSQIGGLQKKLNDIKLGKGDAFQFFRLGINPFQVKDAFEAFDQLRGVIDKVHPSMKGNVLESLGLSPEMLSLLKMTNREMRTFSKFILNKGEVANLRKLGVSMRQFKFGLIDLKNKGLARLAPVLTQAFEKGFNWLVLNSDKIINSISKITKGVGWFIQMVGNSFVLIGDFISRITEMKGGFLVLAGLGAMVASSFKPLTLAFLGLMLLLDDIQVWRTGGDSLFGGLYDSIDKIITKIKGFTGISDVFKGFKEGLIDLHSKFPSLLMAVEALAGALLAMQVINFAKIINGLKQIAKAELLVSLSKSIGALLTSPAGIALGVGLLTAGGIDLAVRGKESVVGQSFEGLKNLFKTDEDKEDEKEKEFKRVNGQNWRDATPPTPPLLLAKAGAYNINNGGDSNKSTTINNYITNKVSSVKEAVEATQAFSKKSAYNFVDSQISSSL